jgi:17beta-estradiol 17-dehydrogenase / very-long-chain 3-oxoacyl-CoA reductase
MVYSFATVIGILCLIVLFYRFAAFLMPYLRPSKLHTYLRPGAYAMVTGATDGIGKAMALELAKAGFNMIIHGRNTGKLQALEKQIRQHYPAADVQLYVMDSRQANEQWQTIDPRLPITVLVNNVGTGPISTFQTMTEQEIQDTININVLFPTKLTRTLLPSMPSPALILNVSSYAGIIPPPYLVVYAGTKAYDHAFSVSLSRERDDLEVISLITGSVTTGTNKKPVTFLRPDAETYARHVLKIVGCGRNTIMPYWPHAVQTWLISLLPPHLIARATKKAMQQELKKG